jgi:negative regulator of genetic competence, sporulation and motility
MRSIIGIYHRKGIVLMELIVISENKLKIMLTAPDMAHYELEGSRMDCADSHTRAAFRHIFRDVRAESGFDTEGERLLVQLYASKEGGCEIFITKLGAARPGAPFGEGEADLGGGEAALLRCLREAEGTDALAARGLAERGPAERAPEDCAPEDDPPTAGMRRTVLVFEELADLLGACRRLSGAGYGGRSTLYITESGESTRWYLLLEVDDTPFLRLSLPYAFLTEYGRETDLRTAEAYLAEHGRVICGERGVEVLGKL